MVVDRAAARDRVARDRVHRPRRVASERRRIKNTLYLARRMERELGRVVFTWGEVTTRDVDQLIAWKSQQYRRSGWRDPFSRKWVRELFELFADTSHGRLDPVYSTLYAGNELVAVDLSLQY